MDPFTHQLSNEEIEKKLHRDFVGGCWDEIGRLPFEFLRSRGLKRSQTLIDIGCGSLRGGLHFIDYLDAGNYYGVDINPSLLDAGLVELAEAGIVDKRPQLAQTSSFDVSRFGRQFDFALAQSLFTHLPFNQIVRCLAETRKVMNAESRFFATFFIAPTAAHLEDLVQLDGVVSHYDQDPYHQSWEEIEFLAKISGLRAELIGPWEHPRNQQMVLFSL